MTNTTTEGTMTETREIEGCNKDCGITHLCSSCREASGLDEPEEVLPTREGVRPRHDEAPAVEVVPNEDRTIEIPVSNRAALEAKLAKLAKRAAKLGCPVSWAWGAVHTVEERRSCRRTPMGCEGCGACNYRGFVVVLRDYAPITVSTVRPSFGGWQFLGTLNHTEIAGSVLRLMVPGVTCPAEAIAAKPGQCDHCRKVRRRTETFIVRSETDGVRVVGRNCIRDFLGHQAPADIANGLSIVWEISSALDEEEREEERERGGSSAMFFGTPVLDALIVAFAVARLDGGFKPAAFEEKSTRSQASTLLFGSGLGAQRAWDAFEEQGGTTLHDCNRAWAALAWICDEEPSSDFMHNLKAICGTDVVTPKTLGIFCALIPAFDRDMMKRAEKSERAPSTYVGTVGKREQLGTGEVERVFSFETQWGSSHIILIRLASGAIIKWKASSLAEWIDRGVKVDVLATVKAHVDYKGTPQTEVTRAKLTQV